MENARKTQEVVKLSQLWGKHTEDVRNQLIKRQKTVDKIEPPNALSNEDNKTQTQKRDAREKVEKREGVSLLAEPDAHVSKHGIDK